MANYLDALLRKTRVADTGTLLPEQRAINFIGATVTDDPTNKMTNVTVTGGGGTGRVVADQDALKALTRSELTDGEQVTVKSTNKVWIWSASTGAGFVGDDKTITELTEGSTSNVGRFYISEGAPIVATLAALRAAVAGVHDTVQVESHNAFGDNGGGSFDKIAGTAVDNDGTIVVPTGITSFYYARRFSGALSGSWFGVKADGTYKTDCVTSASSNIVTTASGGMTQADVGKIFVGRMANSIGAGTLAISTGAAELTGSGTNFAVDMPGIAGLTTGVQQPASGGCIYVVGVGYLAAQYVDYSAHQLIVLNQAITSTSSGHAWYKQTQIVGTITQVDSATQFRISVNATVLETAVQLVFGSDDTETVRNWHQAAIDLGVQEATLPGGNCLITENLPFSAFSNLSIIAPLTNLVRARLASTEAGSPQVGGILTYANVDNFHIEGLGIDGQVPVLGMVHSSGGVLNGGGACNGISWIVATNSSAVALRNAGGYGARDEFLYLGGDSRNFTFDRCQAVGTNNVSINCNAGFDGIPAPGYPSGLPAAKGLKILNCRATGYLLSSGAYIMSGCDVTSLNLRNVIGSVTVDTIGQGQIVNNNFYDIQHIQGIGMVDSFGNLDTNATLLIEGNTFTNVSHPAYTGGGALIHFNNFRGSATIRNNSAIGCISVGAGGRAIYIEGAATGPITVGPNNWQNGTNYSIDTQVAAGVPNGSVLHSKGQYGTDFATPLLLGAGLAGGPGSVTL